MRKLPKSTKLKWVNALRSRKYKQTTGSLHREGGYCCLGVLVKECGVGSKANIAAALDEAEGYGFPPASTISTTAREVLTQPLASDEAETVQTFLVNVNDGGWGFKRIATWIEKNL